MKDWNYLFLQGKIARPLEWKLDCNQENVATFSMEVCKDDTYAERKKRMYVECFAYGAVGERLENYKNRRLMVRGHLQQEKWIDENGKNKSSMKVVVDEFRYID